MPFGATHDESGKPLDTAPKTTDERTPAQVLMDATQAELSPEEAPASAKPEAAKPASKAEEK